MTPVNYTDGYFSGWSVEALDLSADSRCISSLISSARCPSFGTLLSMILSAIRLDKIPPHNMAQMNLVYARTPRWTMAWFNIYITNIVDPVVTYFYIPVVGLFTLINSRIIREVLDEGSTQFFHKIEMYQDLCMIIVPFVMLLLKPL